MRQRILILCAGNSARSQMAEGRLRYLAGNRSAGRSAATRPSTKHPLAAMAERGLDISGQRCKPVDEYRGQAFDCALAVCDSAAQARATFPGGAERLHWSLPDPAAGPPAAAAFCSVRDDLAQRQTRRLSELERQGEPASGGRGDIWEDAGGTSAFGTEPARGTVSAW